MCLRKFYSGTSIVLWPSHFTGTTPRPKHVEYSLEYLPSRQILRKESEEVNKIYMLCNAMEYLPVIINILRIILCTISYL